MTTIIAEMTRAYRSAVEAAEKARDVEQACELALYEVQGRGGCLHAQWIKAYRAGNHPECSRLLKTPEWAAEPMRPDYDVASPPVALMAVQS